MPPAPRSSTSWRGGRRPSSWQGRRGSARRRSGGRCWPTRAGAASGRWRRGPWKRRRSWRSPGSPTCSTRRSTRCSTRFRRPSDSPSRSRSSGSRPATSLRRPLRPPWGPWPRSARSRRPRRSSSPSTTWPGWTGRPPTSSTTPCGASKALGSASSRPSGPTPPSRRFRRRCPTSPARSSTCRSGRSTSTRSTRWFGASSVSRSGAPRWPGWRLSRAATRSWPSRSPGRSSGAGCGQGSKASPSRRPPTSWCASASPRSLRRPAGPWPPPPRWAGRRSSWSRRPTRLRAMPWRPRDSPA